MKLLLKPSVKALLSVVAALGFLLLASSASAFEFGPLKGIVWGGGNKNLVVIMHGDGGPGRYDGMAAALAKQHPGSTIVTLIRPGYSQNGLRSPGRGGGSLADLYTKQNNDAVAKTLLAMQASLKPRKTIVMGHSGGSGQMGSIIGRYPGIADAVLLVSCPCNVPQWRLSRRGRNNWVRSQSPIRYVSKISAKTKIYAITGTNDGNTKIKFAIEYVDAAKAAGKNATMVAIPNGTHSWSTLQSTAHKLLSKEMR